MHITIENNTVVVNLDETEFPLFEAMFANLKLEKKVSVEMRKFPNIGGQFSWNLLPMHLCRTIGEANLSADPFATVSLYPFWKYGSAWPTAEGSDQTILPSYTYFCGSSQASSLSAEFTWENSSTTERIGRSPLSTNASGARRFEAKGTTGTASALTQSLKEGKYQAFALDAQSPIKHRVVVGTALGEPVTKVILMDPPPSTPLGDHNENRSLSGAETPGDDDPVGAIHELPLRTNLTADLVRSAAMTMRRRSVGVVRERPGADTRTVHEPPLQTPEPPTTIFRGPTREIALTNELKPKKKHSWLDINT